MSSNACVIWNSIANTLSLERLAAAANALGISLLYQASPPECDRQQSDSKGVHSSRRGILISERGATGRAKGQDRATEKG